MHRLGQRFDARDAADRDHVVAQPQQGAPKRLGVGFDREPRRTLALALGGAGGELEQRLADAVISPPQDFDVDLRERSGEEFGDQVAERDVPAGRVAHEARIGQLGAKDVEGEGPGGVEEMWVDELDLGELAEGRDLDGEAARLAPAEQVVLRELRREDEALELGPEGIGLNVGSIAVFARNNDPNQSIILATTGDPDALGVQAPGAATRGDSPSLTSRGIGFLRSTDGGATWQLLDSSSNFDAAGNLLPVNSPLRDHMFISTVGYKITVDPNPPPYPDRFPHHHGATVTITLKDGRRFSDHVDFPRGSAPRGVEWADVDAKYRRLVPLSGMAPDKVEATLAVVHGFDTVKTVSELTRLLH